MQPKPTPKKQESSEKAPKAPPKSRSKSPQESSTKASRESALDSRLDSTLSAVFTALSSVLTSAIDTQARVSLKKLARLDSRTLRLFGLRIVLGCSLALIFCAWIYVFVYVQPYFTQDSPYIARLASTLLISALVLASFSVYLLVPRRLIAYFGFFSGLGLFYWISLSFRFSVMPSLIPLICLGIGAGYALLFSLGLCLTTKLYRLASLFVLGMLTPFSFDWFVPQSWLAYSVFSVSNLSFLGILGALGYLFGGLGRFSWRAWTCGIILLLCVDWQQLRPSQPLESSPSLPPLRTQLALVQSNIPQDLKWQQEGIDSVIASVLRAIDAARLESTALIVFPETILPFLLNGTQPYQQQLREILREKSAHITIVLGSFSQQHDEVHNSTYVFDRGEMRILNKVILAPFGERIPLPDFLAKPLYRLFFDLDEGLQGASEPQDFAALGRIWRNAICYEGTSNATYANAPRYVMMISNNAWFAPSIEPFLQQVLLKYYARRYGTTIAHAANYSHAILISPLVDDMSPALPLSRFALESHLPFSYPPFLYP